ncbi:hypothetical protein Pelo_2561 [Pelomyxa schiedti]|nr:hypothetical protein Pelo_2561 [Pelomyxa schiedti]
MAERKKDLISAETRQQMEASMFEQQLNDISTKTIDTLERVKAETKINLEKEEAIQNATATIASLSEEISHIDISLEEVRKYKQFLDAAASFEETCALKGTASKEPTSKSPPFLSIFWDQLEKQNILLLAQKEESDQLLDHATVKKKYLATKTDHEQMELQRQIEEIQQAVDIERVNEAQLLEREIQQNDASNVHDHVEEVIQLEEKISEIFQDLTVETSTTKPLSSIEMITEIEICADKLLAQLNALPADYVQKALKDKVKDRRRRQRDSKREIEKTHAEELRSKVSSDHTTLKSTRKRDGKPAMFRSTLSLKASSVTAKHHTKEEEEDLLYFVANIRKRQTQKQTQKQTHQAPSCETDMERELSGLPPDIQALLMAAPFGRDARGAPLATQPNRPRRGTRAHQSSSPSSSAITAAPTTTTTATSSSAASGSSSSSSTPDPDNNTPAAAASSASSSSSCATTTTTTTSTTSASLGSPSPSAPHRSSSSSSSPRQQLSTKTRSFSSSSSLSSSSTVITSSTPSAVTKSQHKPKPNPPKPKRGKVSGKVEPRKPLVAVGLTPTISTITPPAALAEGARVAETVTETNVPSVTSSSSTKPEDPIGTLTNNASEDKSAVPSDTTTAASADNNGAETRMTSASTGVTTLVGHVTTTKVPSGNFQVTTSSVELHIEGIYLREQMVSLLAGTLPRCGSASALRFLTPSLLYSVFIWARATEKRLVIVLRTSTGQGTPEDRALKLGLWQDAGVISSELEVNPVWRSPEEPWLVTFAGEDHYVVHQKNGPGTPSIFKLRNVQRPGDSRVLLVIPTPPPREFHCRTNSHWVLYHYGAEPEFYVEPALLPPTPPQIGSASSSASSSSSLLKVQQEELGLLEGHVISLVTLSKREPHLALLVSCKVNANSTQAECDIIFWNVKKSVESKRFH